MQNYYDILEVNENSTQDEIKKSYQNLILKYHPDKNDGNNEDSQQTTDKFMLIDEAWKTLRDPNLRNVYNAELKQKQFKDNPIVYEKLTIKEFSYDECNDEYFYMCRCGGVYIVNNELSHQNDDCFISCDECSLVIQLIKTETI